MPAASKVVLVPPEAWDERLLIDAARDLDRANVQLRPGDEVSGLTVIRVEPAAALTPDAQTVFEILAAPRTAAPGKHVALVVDASRSMALPFDDTRDRIHAARDAAHAYLRSNAQALDAASIFTFSKDARLETGPVPQDQLSEVRIEAPKPHGPARTAAALDAVLAHLAAQPDAPAQAIVLLADTPSDLKELRHVAARAVRLRIPIHVLAFAPQLDDAFRVLAKSTGGRADVAKGVEGFDLEFWSESS